MPPWQQLAGLTYTVPDSSTGCPQIKRLPQVTLGHCIKSCDAEVSRFSSISPKCLASSIMVEANNTAETCRWKTAQINLIPICCTSTCKVSEIRLLWRSCAFSEGVFILTWGTWRPLCPEHRPSVVVESEQGMASSISSQFAFIPHFETTISCTYRHGSKRPSGGVLRIISRVPDHVVHDLRPGCQGAPPKLHNPKRSESPQPKGHRYKHACLACCLCMSLHYTKIFEAMLDHTIQGPPHSS